MSVKQVGATSLFVLWAALISAAAEQPGAMPYPPLPEGISSFGATISGNSLYVFGGHMGRVAGNSLDSLSPHFCRLNLATPEAGWEELPMQQSSQSPGLVGWNGLVYRAGGLSFRNRFNEDTAFESLDVFSKFDPQTKTWTNLPPLPAPRSSLDAAVVDGRLYVVGGWNLQEGGSGAAVWHDTALAFDLAKEDGQWTTIAPPPFQTRALAAAAHNHKLYVLGGMKSTNQTTREVHIYDPQTDEWTAGPELKSANNFGGFAISAFATGGKLYYCGGDGTVYVLNDAGDDWQPVERLIFSRMFHRVVPTADDTLAIIAGISGGTYLGNLEVVNVAADTPRDVKSVSWSVPFAGSARHSQALFVHGGALYAFGGNRSPKPHDFSKNSFVDEAFRFDLAARNVEQLPNLPQPVQSGGVFLAGSRIDQSLYVVGGLSHVGDKFQSTAVIQRYRLRSKAWMDELSHLPASRAMFGMATYNGAAWIFGGSQVQTAASGLSAETWQWNPVATDKAAVVPEATIPVSRRSFGAAVLGDKFYAVGGLGAESQIVGTVNVFDFKTQEWSEIPAPKYSRVFPSLAAAGGKLYLSGGFSRVDGHFAGTTAIEVFDPQTNTWTTAFEELAPQLAEMTMLEYQDRLLFYSIDKDQAGLAHFVIVDPSPQTVGAGALPRTNEERSGPPEQVVQLMRLDKNGDGKLAADEVGARFQPIIAQADTDGDGLASREEIEAYVRQSEASAAGAAPGGEPRARTGDPAQFIARIFEEHDKNQDGKLTGEEIPARFRENLERTDTNGDGAIDKSELEALFKRSDTPAGQRPANN